MILAPDKLYCKLLYTSYKECPTTSYQNNL